MGIVGVLIERSAYRPLRNAPRLAPLITAIGVSFILQNIVQIFYGPFQTNSPQIFPTDWFIEIGKARIPVLSFFVVAVAMGLMIVTCSCSSGAHASGAPCGRPRSIAMPPRSWA